MDRVIKVGSRDSKLAVAQTELIINQIKKVHPELTFELVTMKTTGDKILDRSLDEIGGKGLFVKELDKALLEGKVDFTVHSLKDLPMEIPGEIPLLGFSSREDPRDALIVKEGGSLDIGNGCIGTSSKRRMIQLKKLYPAAEFKGIRGNVQTRLRKLSEQDYKATVLAIAGLKRLHMEHVIARIFSADELIPAAGQGILAMQGRKGEDYSWLNCVCDRDSGYAALAERSFVACLDGGCSSPVAAYAEVAGEELLLRGLYYDESTGQFTTGRKRGNAADAEKIGEQLAEELRK